jgi:hypothetical protein
MRLAKRISDLEAQQGHSFASLNHLSDAELEAYAFNLIERMGTEGVTLPEDWKEQYHRSEIRFLQWLEAEAREVIACET